MKRLLAISMTLICPVEAFAKDAKNLLKPVNKAESWRLEKHEADAIALVQTTPVTCAEEDETR
jgi:hypothetical protein